MGFRLTHRRAAVVALVLVALALTAAGCGGPKLRADQVVGKWRIEGGQSSDIVLDLGPDGMGMSRFLRPPHEQSIRWSLAGSELTTSAMDETVTIRYRCRVPGPDRLVVTTGKSESALVRVK
jgi:hypothetical protein